MLQRPSRIYSIPKDYAAPRGEMNIWESRGEDLQYPPNLGLRANSAPKSHLALTQSLAPKNQKNLHYVIVKEFSLLFKSPPSFFEITFVMLQFRTYLLEYQGNIKNHKYLEKEKKQWYDK